MPVRWKRKGVPQEAAGELQRVGSRLAHVSTLVALVAAAADATMRMRSRMWLQPPLHVERCCVQPPDSLPDDALDEAMRAFARDVLATEPRPAHVMLDQNLQSKVARTANATTGTALETQLRDGGHEGVDHPQGQRIGVQRSRGVQVGGCAPYDVQGRGARRPAARAEQRRRG